MKKILTFILSCLLLLTIAACDNNEGPFDLRKENGKLILYSNDKPAKGWVEDNLIDFNTGISSKTSEIEYSKGLPTGKFKFYNTDGILFWDADLKKDEELYKGVIKFYSHKGDSLGKMEGIFSINSDWIINGNRNFDYLSVFHDIAIDAIYDSKTVKGSYKNGSADGEWIDFVEGKISEKTTVKKGKKDGLYERFSPSGEVLETGNYIDDKKEGVWSKKEYNKNNEVIRWSKKSYKDNKLDGEYENFEINLDRKIYEKGNYKKGLKEGLWEYFVNDKPRLRETYKIISTDFGEKAVLEGLWSYYDEVGNLIETGNLIDNNSTGNWQYFYNNKLVMERNYSTGEKKEYYENGNIKFEVFSDSSWNFFDESGNLIDQGMTFSRMGVMGTVAPDTVKLFRLTYAGSKNPLDGPFDTRPWY